MENGNVYCHIGDSVKTTIDRFGRIVVPKKIRERHGIVPGSDIEIEDSATGILLRPMEDLPGLIEKEGILIFRGRPTADLEASIRNHRRNRIADFRAEIR